VLRRQLRKMTPSLPDVDQSLRNVGLGFLEDVKDLVLRTPARRFASNGYAQCFSGCLQLLHGMNRLDPSRDVTHRMQEMVTHLETDLIGLQQVTFSLFSGTTGDLWLLDKFCSRGAMESLLSVYRRYDDELLRHLGSLRDESGYDLVSGLVGVAVEQVQRQAFPRDERVLPAILKTLFAAAEPGAKGIRWKTYASQVNIEPHQVTQFPEGVYDLGMAHGLCGVIAFLSDVAPREHAGLEVFRVLQGACANLQSHIPCDREAHIPYLEGNSPNSRLG
jgi:lanthionine synthetase-like protein